MLSRQPTGVPHLGQCDGGETMDLSSGSRRMQTLRKLPMTAPKRAPMMAAASDSLTRHLVEEDPGRDGHVERLRSSAEADPDPSIGPGGEGRADPGALVADHERERHPLRAVQGHAVRRSD